MSSDASAILGTYPRTRPALSPALKALYVSQYADNRAGKGIANKVSQYLEGWMHESVERGQQKGQTVLEVGAGNLNHVSRVDPSVTYDAVEPFRSLYEQHPELSRVRRMYDYVQEIELAPAYDRIFSIAVLEHLTDLPLDVAQCALLLKADGVFQAGVPCEGELGWWLGWNMSTSVAFRLKHGLDYSELMRHEHVNTLKDIVAVVSMFFGDVVLRRSPLILPAKNLSFYAYIEARKPNTAYAELISRTYRGQAGAV